MVATGEVIRVWDRFTRPPKRKRLICICPESQKFLRINTKAVFPPHYIIRGDGADFLDHDSFVELQQMVRPYASDIAAAETLGRLGQTHITGLLIAVETCVALSDEDKDFISEKLRSIQSS